MARQDWSNLGDDIRNMVQSAIDSKDFQQLNQSINRTINDAMQNINKGFQKAGRNMGYSNPRGPRPQPQNPWDNRARSHRTYEPAPAPRQVSAYFAQTGSSSALAIVLTVIGGLLAGSAGIVLLVMLLYGIFGGVWNLGVRLTIGLMIPFLAGGGFMLGKGIGILGRLNRFKAYVRELQGQPFCPISSLAEEVGKSPNYVLKDVKDMIKRRMFLEGHVDKQNTCLIVTEEAYSQYLDAQRQLEDRKQQEQRQEQQQRQEQGQTKEHSSREDVPEETRKMIEEGQAYIREIHACNDAIPGEEISGKISKMELIVRKIFARVEKEPELAADLRKFMEYYLPTTVKLLHAYEELDAQPIQGANILSSKKEIEDTLDTINQAFENLLDSFFQDAAWDISSDISVLQAMLAQEGLTNSAFDKKENRKD